MSPGASPTLLILVCHTPLASALHSVVDHGFGMVVSALGVLDVPSSATPQSVGTGIEALWRAEGSPAEVLVLTDLLGATPSNGASAWLAQAPGTRAGVTGVSLPILLRAMSHRDLKAAALAALLRASAPDCITILPGA